MLLLESQCIFSKFAFVFHRFDPSVLLYNKSLNDWSLELGNSEFCFPQISMLPKTKLRETLRFSGCIIQELIAGILRKSSNSLNNAPNFKPECKSTLFQTKKVKSK